MSCMFTANSSCKSARKPNRFVVPSFKKAASWLQRLLWLKQRRILPTKLVQIFWHLITTKAVNLCWICFFVELLFDLGFLHWFYPQQLALFALIWGISSDTSILRDRYVEGATVCTRSSKIRSMIFLWKSSTPGAAFSMLLKTHELQVNLASYGFKAETSSRAASRLSHHFICLTRRRCIASLVLEAPFATASKRTLFFKLVR